MLRLRRSNQEGGRLTLQQDLAGVADACETLIRVHVVDDTADVCQRCRNPYPCYPRLTAEDLAEGLARLPLLDAAALSGAAANEDRLGDIMQTQEQRDALGTTAPGIDPAGDEGWHKSTFSDNSGGNCVEVKSVGGAFAVRDSKAKDSPILVFSSTEWLAFTQGVRAGQFDE